MARGYDENGIYSYTSEEEETSSTPSGYSTPPATTSAPSGYANPPSLPPSPSPSPSQAPSPPSSYSTPPSLTTAPSKAPDTSGPTDEEIEALMAANGGRLSSRAMRQLELQVRARNGTSPQLPKGPALSETDRKREKIMSRIPKTKTKDSEGGDLGFVTNEGEGLAGKKLVSHYEGESKGRAWRAGNREKAAANWKMDPSSPEFEERWQKFRSSDASTTHYDEGFWDREKSQLKEKGGGKVKTTHQERQYSNSDTHGWVMDPSSGNVHTFDPGLVRERDGKRQFTHHSSPLAGGNVAGAGMMTIKDKHITEVTDESGHYRPEGEYTYQAVGEMAKRGLLDRKADEDDEDEYEAGPGNLSAKVSLAGYVEDDPRQQKGWLKDEEGIYKDMLTLPYQAFLQTKGNERQARAKKSMQDELLSKVKRVDDGPEEIKRPGASSLGNGSAPSAYPSVYVDDLDQLGNEPTGTYVDDLDQLGNEPTGTYTYTTDEDHDSDSDSHSPVGYTYTTDEDHDSDSDDDGYVEDAPLEGYTTIEDHPELWDTW